jgi:polysaccharide export outer membrane protein
MGTVLVVVLLVTPPKASPQDKLVTAQETNERIRQLSMLSQVHQGEYVVGPGDLLTIQVFDVSELSRDVRVSEQGTIALPLLPARLHAAGLTEIQVEQKLEEVLASSGLVTHPQVSVVVKERKSNPITVIGAVARPLVYQAVRPVTLLEVLSEAGGIANDAGSVVLITRTPGSIPAATATNTSTTGNPSEKAVASTSDAQTPREPAFPSASQQSVAAQEPGSATEAGNSSVLTISLIDLLETGDPKYNISLQGGDVVSIPRAGVIYVMGAVEHPGGFVLSNDRQAMSVLKVMALAGGPKPTAKSSQSIILRKGGVGGPQQELPLDLRKIMEHKAEDVKLNAGDIVFIPDSSGKRAVRRLGEIALAIGTGAVVFRLAR